jgi:hypothetical protein
MEPSLLCENDETLDIWLFYAEEEVHVLMNVHSLNSAFPRSDPAPC